MEKQLVETIEELKRLKKINEVLIKRSLARQNGDGAFKIFEKNATLLNQVKERTQELEEATKLLTEERDVFEAMLAALPGALILFSKEREVKKIVYGANFNSLECGDLTNLETDQGNLGNVLLAKIHELTLTNKLLTAELQVINHPALTRLDVSFSTKNLESFVVFIQDKSQSQRQEETIKQQDAQILQSSKLASLGEMAAGVAHEINNPLAIIHSSAVVLEMVKKKYNLNYPELDEISKTIDVTVSRISKIIKAMRNLSRDAKFFEKKEKSLDEIVDEVLALCGEKFRHHNVKFKNLYRERGEQPVILCDYIQISQVILNLFGNSFDAIAKYEEKWIEIDFKQENGEDVILVTDSGPGIPGEVVKRIFDPFYTSKEIGKGTGLGLSISRTILEKHGGSISVDPSCEHTRFVLRIPSRSTCVTLTA